MCPGAKCSQGGAKCAHGQMLRGDVRDQGHALGRGGMCPWMADYDRCLFKSHHALFVAQQRVSFYTLSPNNMAMGRCVDVVWDGLYRAASKASEREFRSYFFNGICNNLQTCINFYTRNAESPMRRWDIRRQCFRIVSLKYPVICDAFR